jgi:uncharacterized protein Smg (DUF494 family)
MRQTLIKLVDAILRRLEEHPEVSQTETGIRLWLTQQGYNKRDIEDALRLVRPRFAHNLPEYACRPTTVRPLSDAELQKLAPEARAALARLEIYNLLDPYEREMVLERLHQFEGIVGMDELDYLLSWVVYGSRDVETQQTMFNVLEGRRGTYH